VVRFIETLKSDYRFFVAARPGERFRDHYRRTQARKTTAASIARVTVGIILIVGGVVLWVLPGPGWLLILFALAIFAGESEGLAGGLDHFEITARARVRRLRTWLRGTVATPPR
jgi:hypothetical protein